VFSLKKLNTHAGCMNDSTMQIVHDYLFYLGTDGVVYRMNTTKTDVDITMTKELSIKLNLFVYPISLTFEDMLTMTSVFNNNKFYLINSKIMLVYDYRFTSWSIFRMPPMNCSIVLNNVLLFGGVNGYVYQPSDDYSDDGIPIVCYWASKRFDQGLPSNYKQFKELFVIAHVYNSFKSNLFIRYEIDYIDINQIADIANQISMWGRALWGDRFITRNISPSLPINIGRRGRKMRIIIMNGDKIRASVNTYSDLLTFVNPVANDVFQVLSDGKLYRYNLSIFTLLNSVDTFQPLKIYEINGEYTIKGKR